MRFLFVLDSVENPASANAQLGRRLAGELAARGHAVQLLELWDGLHPLPDCPLPRRALAFGDERLMNDALENGRRGGSPVWLRLVRLAAHPTAVTAAFRQLVLHRPRRTVAARRAMEDLDAGTPFDAVCAVCAPYRSAFALQNARLHGKKILWQMDPYGSDRSYAAPGGYVREGELLDAVDRSFIEASYYGDYEPGGPLAAYRDKIRVLGLPALLPGEAAEQPHDGLRCTFCGSMAPGVRDPAFALELFCNLNAPDLTLTLAGPGLRGTDTARTVLGDRLVLPGPVPVAAGEALRAEADILLNLGNEMDNQIPSKLFEYMGTGKPILHLAAHRDDLCCRYLRDYPLALILCREDGAGPDAVKALRGWLDAVRGQRVPYDEVAARFPRFTPAGAADDFLEGV